MKVDLLKEYKRILALAQAGKFYGKDVFDLERYQELEEIATRLISDQIKADFEELAPIIYQQEGYPTPKVDVRAWIVEDDQILLVEDRRSHEWSLPGGYAEVGISPQDNIRKEVLEETGLTVEVTDLIAVFDTDLRKDIPQLFQYYKLVFTCEISHGSFQTNHETQGCQFFSLDALPPLSLERTTVEQLKILKNLDGTYFD